MWADTVFTLEYHHLMRLMIWGASCAVAGTLALVWCVRKSVEAPLVRAFAMTCLVGGAATVVAALTGWRGLALRDFAGLQQLLGVLWLVTGMAVGVMASAVAIMLLAFRHEARPTVMGAGLSVFVQALALMVFHIGFIAAIGPVQ